MADDSYTLREVAELLGVSKRTLGRRMQEGAFPNRFLCKGRHGLETRIPAEDVRRVVEDLRRHGREQPRAITVRPGLTERTMVPDLPIDVPVESALAAYEVESIDGSRVAPNALSRSDVESLRHAMLSIVREEREMFLAAVRSALTLRDREVAGLKGEVVRMREVMDDVRSGVERLERRVRTESKREAGTELHEWVDAVAPTAIDIDAVLRELGELESLLGVWDGGGP